MWCSYKMGTSPSLREVDLVHMTRQAWDIRQVLPRRKLVDSMGSNTHKISSLTENKIKFYSSFSRGIQQPHDRFFMDPPPFWEGSIFLVSLLSIFHFFFLDLVYFNNFPFFSRDIETLKCWERVHVKSFHPQLDVIVAFLLMTSMWFSFLDFALVFC